MIERVVRRLARMAGYDLRRRHATPWGRLNSYCCRTIIDVGVAKGTSELYQAFPNAFLVLIDPLRECRPFVEQLLAEREGEWIEMGLGRGPTELEINVERSVDMSSFRERLALTQTGHRQQRRRVPIDALDNLAEARNWPVPYGLKIDTEGYEDEVLSGAIRTLAKCSFVVAEASVQKRFAEGYRFEELIAQMNSYGFRVANILAANPDRNGIVRVADLVFAPEAA